MKVYLIGVGMGDAGTVTVAGAEAIKQSDLLIGASRLLRPYRDREQGIARNAGRECRLIERVRTDDIVRAIKRAQDQGVDQVSVLLSGDVGFYSGAAGLYEQLTGFDVQVIPGISSLVYFCAKLCTSWQDAALVSAHGREHDAVGTIQTNAKTFCITGGATKVQHICQDLVKRGLGDVEVAAGERLSYPEERIVRGTAAELAKQEFANLSVLLALNPNPVTRAYATPSLADDDFQRGRAPMTKQEVRAIVMSKLRIQPHHTVWDVGAGTGSVTVEAALAANRGLVCAVEKRHEAVELLQQNCQLHGATNVKVVEGEAPFALMGLPAPDRVFIGGSSRNLLHIIALVENANPLARICATAVTLETLNDLLECLQQFGVWDADIVQVAVTRAQKTGRYHMMHAENPIFIVTADLAERELDLPDLPHSDKPKDRS